MVRRCGLVVMMLMIALMFTGVSAAQDSDKKVEKAAAPAKDRDSWSFYKLDLTVREMDGAKTVNARTYNISQGLEDWGQLRVGSRIPIMTSASQFQYFDVGLNLDSRLRERGDVLSMDWRLELSSIASENASAGQSSSNPIVRSVKNNGQTILPLGKPVMMSSIDDTSSTHKFVFEVTATRVK